MFERYAIFYTPSAGAFADFGAAWLGWDSAAGTPQKHPFAQDIDVAALTATPRRYGFHATLKAPFHLVEGQNETALSAAMQTLAKDLPPVALDRFELVTTHGFLALRPTCDPVPIQRAVAQVVTTLDSFRAPLTEADIARRRTADLTKRQDQQMLEWGYPFVFEDFHFHMTLSGSLDQRTLDAAKPRLEALIAPVLPTKPMLDAITLMGQDSNGMFHQIHRAVLSGCSAL